jgi:alpha-1,2-mannosyltransferase
MTAVAAPARSGAMSPRDRAALIGGGAAIFLLVFVFDVRPWDLHDAMMIGAPIGRDFVNFWVGGRLAIEGRLDILVDFDRYNDLIFQLFHHNARGLVFSYPPHILLLLVPFGALPFLPAVLIYSAGNVALLAAATRLIARERVLAVAACLSPAALMMVVVGHFGGLLAFLAVFILVRGGSRPLLAGCCLALMTIKPQFAAGFGLLLLLVGHWRVVLAAVPATAALIALSVLAFGIDPWIGFFDWTLPFHAQLLSGFQVGAFRTAMSVYTTARMVGLADTAARVLQLLYGLPFLAAAAVVFVRQGGARAPRPRGIALALFAVLAMLPYTAIHDFAIVAPALAAALFADPGQEEPEGHAGRPFLALGGASAVWFAPALAIPFGHFALPLVPVVILTAMALALAGEFHASMAAALGRATGR